GARARARTDAAARRARRVRERREERRGLEGRRARGLSRRAGRRDAPAGELAGGRAAQAARGRGRRMTPVKGGGITRLDGARLAPELGAAALGFVLAPSPRRVEPQVARAIAAALPPAIERVGVFVDADAATIRAAVRAIGLTRVQLHGRETPR